MTASALMRSVWVNAFPPPSVRVRVMVLVWVMVPEVIWAEYATEATWTVNSEPATDTTGISTPSLRL